MNKMIKNKLQEITELFNMIKEFDQMKINLYDFAIKHAEEFDLTSTQIKILKYILDEKNWLKSKSEIALKTNTTRPTVNKVFSILETLFDEYKLKKERK